jgi:hypothetical protein
MGLVRRLLRGAALLEALVEVKPYAFGGLGAPVNARDTHVVSEPEAAVLTTS